MLLKVLASPVITKILLPLLILELILSTVFAPGAKLYGSALFLTPLLLFLINLGSCTFLRIRRRKSWKNVLLAGPDLIHIALILIILFGIATPFLRQEEELSVREGDIIHIPEAGFLELGKLSFNSYKDGRPSSWHVEISRRPELSGELSPERRREESLSLEVNHPLSLGKTKIYLSSFATTPLALVERNGKREIQDLSEGMMIGGQLWTLRRVSLSGDLQDSVEFEREGRHAQMIRGERNGDILLEEIRLVHSARLLLVRQPLRPAFAVSFILLAAGLILTLIQKNKAPASGKGNGLC